MLAGSLLVLIGTRGRHPGWIVLLGIAACVWFWQPTAAPEATSKPEDVVETVLDESPAPVVISDPAGFDPNHPPAMAELSFDSSGSRLNGLMYLAAGEGPHPVVLFVHGYPGNERNLDLAQAVRRAGYHALYFNYRGSWGSGGEFSLSNGIDDVAAAVAWLRREDIAAQYRIDSSRIAVVGHSVGGFLSSQAVARDDALECLVFLAGANAALWGQMALSSEEARQGLTAGFGGTMVEGGPIAAEPDAVIQDMIDNVEAFDLVSTGRCARGQAPVDGGRWPR